MRRRTLIRFSIISISMIPTLEKLSDAAGPRQRHDVEE